MPPIAADDTPSQLPPVGHATPCQRYATADAFAAALSPYAGYADAFSLAPCCCFAAAAIRCADSIYAADYA